MPARVGPGTLYRAVEEAGRKFFRRSILNGQGGRTPSSSRIAHAQKGSAPTLKSITLRAASARPGTSTGSSNTSAARKTCSTRGSTKIRQRFISVSGGHPDTEMMNLFRHCESRGFAFEQPPQGSGGVDPGLLSAERCNRRSDALMDFINRPWRPSTRVSPGESVGAPPGATQAPDPGTIRQGRNGINSRFKGGDPWNRSNWEPVQ
jgi:hypothetical protein